MIALASAVGCSSVDFEPPSELAARTVYGSDDRTEYFQVAQPEWRETIAAANVALIRKSYVDSSGRLDAHVPSWREAGNLCSDEPFADQPAAAFCSGVLVDWDLVLTAGHCMRVLALEDFAVVFGYYNDGPGVLGVGDGDIVDAVEIVSERMDASSVSPRLDYAWVRLRHPVVAPHRPWPVRMGIGGLRSGDFLASIGASGGTPLKFDAGGTYRDLRREQSDYFIADTDTFGGSSGGGAFDQQGSLVGILARGGQDLTRDPAGCNRSFHQTNAGFAEEQYTYAYRAVADLCKLGPQVSSICRADRGDPDVARPLPPFSTTSSCALAQPPHVHRANGLCAAFMIALAAFGFRCRRRFVRSHVNLPDTLKF
jgi:hypothetical protein